MSSGFTLADLTSMGDYDAASMQVVQARQLINRFVKPLEGRETINLDAALKRTLAADIHSPINVPPHDYSAMDGYAIHVADLVSDPARLRLAGDSFAGHPYPGEVVPGECVRIMTGALIPDGCDCVVMQEHVRPMGKYIEFGSGHRPGQNIRRIGEDMRKGDVVLARGQSLHPAAMGLLASLGFSEVEVFRKPRVAVFSTGDELRQPGEDLAAGQIYDSNRYTLIGLLNELGVEIIDLGCVRDDSNNLRAALLDASTRADIIITSGGVSVGEADFIKQLLAEIGEVVFWKIAMKPGKPLAYGRIGDSHFFGLPGNPVAVMVTFRQFVHDALCVLAGQTPPPPLNLRAKCLEDLRKSPGRMEFQRGILSHDEAGDLVVRSTGNQGSGILSSMCKANCFIMLPLEQGNLEAGSMVEVQPFDCYTAVRD